MVRKKSDDERSYDDSLTPSLSFTVQGTEFFSMILQAKSYAASILNLQPNDVYIMSHGAMTERESTRFVDPQRIALWSMNVAVGVIPESHREEKPDLAVVTPMKTPERRKTVRRPRRKATTDEQS